MIGPADAIRMARQSNVTGSRRLARNAMHSRQGKRVSLLGDEYYWRPWSHEQQKKLRRLLKAVDEFHCT